MLEKFRNALPRRGRQGAAPQAGPQQAGPQQTGPQQGAAPQTGPQQTGPQQGAAPQTGPQQTGPQQTGPQQTGKHRVGLHRVGLHRVGLHRVGLHRVKDRLSQLKPAEAVRYGLGDLNTLRRQVADSDVIRHRRAGSPLRRQFRAQMAGRRRHLVAVAAALSMVGVATVAANAAVNDPPPVEASQQLADARAAIAERQAASERTDRSDRDPDPQDDGESRDGGQSRGANPEESPKPSDDDRENEDSSGDEPAQDPTEESAPPEPESEPQPDWAHPMPGASTTSCYGMRWGAMHAGVDLAAPEGTPIKAVGAGTVTEAGWAFGGYGISVVIDHGDGHFTHYAHASQAKVSVGDKVSPGQTIALEGNTGDSTGPHLHFEVHKGMWNQVEPTAWMNNRGVNIGGC